MKTMLLVLLALLLLTATVAVADEIDERLRSYDQGREDAQAELITSGAKDQSAYDTGYREQRDGNKPETNQPTEDKNQ